MSVEKDPLLKDMMMDSKQFIQDPAFGDIIMNKIMKQDKKRFIMKRAVFYCIPILCIVTLLILFSRSMVRDIQSITIQLTADKIFQFFSAVSDYLRVFMLLLILAIVQRWMPARKTA